MTISFQNIPFSSLSTPNVECSSESFSVLSDALNSMQTTLEEVVENGNEEYKSRELRKNQP